MSDVQDAPAQAQKSEAGKPETLIEVRGLGIAAVAHGAAPVAMAFDLAARPDRLPDPVAHGIAGVTLPLLALDPFELSAPLKVEAASVSFEFPDRWPALPPRLSAGAS